MKGKILVIDDEEKVYELIADILRPRGYEVVFALDGAQGIVQARETQPDLILLDIMLPKMDGFEVQKTLKSDEKTKNIPVVFVTARTALEDSLRALSMGAAGYIEKPFEVKRLLRKVESLLARPDKDKQEK